MADSYLEQEISNEEPTLEQVEKRLDNIIDEKYQEFMDTIKSEIDCYSMNTPEHQISAALKRYFS